jgi:hypothetical protein
MITSWKNRISGFLMVATLMLLSSCGGSGSGGEGISSSSASLEIALNSATVASGSPVTATITLKALAGSAVNGVQVQVSSNDPSVIGTYGGYTNTSGIAHIQLPAQWVSSDRTVSLYATSKGITPSTTVQLKVIAPKLTCSIPVAITPPTFKSNVATIGKTITSNYQLKFLDGNGDPIPNQVITLYIDSLTNKSTNDQIVYTPVQGNMIIAPPGVFTGTTDSSGLIIIPMYIQMALDQPAPCSTDPTTGIFKCTGTALSIMTANWRAVVQFAGQSITTTGSSLITFTNSGV